MPEQSSELGLLVCACWVQIGCPCSVSGIPHPELSGVSERRLLPCSGTQHVLASFSPSPQGSGPPRRSAAQRAHSRFSSRDTWHSHFMPGLLCLLQHVGWRLQPCRRGPVSGPVPYVTSSDFGSDVTAGLREHTCFPEATSDPNTACHNVLASTAGKAWQLIIFSFVTEDAEL